MSVTTKTINGRTYSLEFAELSHKDAVNGAAAVKRNILSWDFGRRQIKLRRSTISVRAVPYQGKWAVFVSDKRF